LRALSAAAQKDDQNGTALHVIDAVAGAIVDPKLADALPDRPYVARIAEGKRLMRILILA
jgi:hypothetical protein